MNEQERRRYLALQAFFLKIETMTKELLRDYWPEMYTDQSEQGQSKNGNPESPPT